MTTFETPDSLNGETRQAVIDLLYRLADDELIIGHRNSEWTGLGPILEADIAFSSMAQDEMGHALAYYSLLEALGEGDPDGLVFARAPGKFRCAAFVALDKGDWAFSIVRQYLYDVAENVRLTALCQSSYVPLARLARKLIAEEKYHLMHGLSWIARLGPSTEESHERMRKALNFALPHALGVFEPTPFESVLADAGVCPPESDLRDRWLASIRQPLADAGLECEPLPEAAYGGRAGRHPQELGKLLKGMRKVFELDPAAAW